MWLPRLPKIRRGTKKRKMTLQEIGRCHPKQKVAGTRGVGVGIGVTGRTTKGCLPSSVYSTVKRSRRGGKGERDDGKKGANGANGANGASVYGKVGCAEDADHCLLDNVSLSDDKKKALRRAYLRPRRPKEWQKKPNQWLDNFNIQHVMEQYEEAYLWFHFLGVFPIDFSAPDPYQKQMVNKGQQTCLNRELCELNLQKEYDRGIRGIGMVFNLDPHYKGGSHWVALWIDLSDLEKGRAMAGFFDSYGYETPPMIARFMRSLQLQVKECVLGYNARRFQYGGSECGMFSLYFLICMIHGIPFEEFCKDALHDRSMLELRSVLFGA